MLEVIQRKKAENNDLLMKGVLLADKQRKRDSIDYKSKDVWA